MTPNQGPYATIDITKEHDDVVGQALTPNTADVTSVFFELKAPAQIIYRIHNNFHLGMILKEADGTSLLRGSRLLFGKKVPGRSEPIWFNDQRRYSTWGDLNEEEQIKSEEVRVNLNLSGGLVINPGESFVIGVNATTALADATSHVFLQVTQQPVMN